MPVCLRVCGSRINFVFVAHEEQKLFFKVNFVFKIRSIPNFPNVILILLSFRKLMSINFFFIFSLQKCRI